MKDEIKFSGELISAIKASAYEIEIYFAGFRSSIGHLLKAGWGMFVGPYRGEWFQIILSHERHNLSICYEVWAGNLHSCQSVLAKLRGCKFYLIENSSFSIRNLKNEIRIETEEDFSFFLQKLLDYQKNKKLNSQEQAVLVKSVERVA